MSQVVLNLLNQGIIVWDAFYIFRIHKVFAALDCLKAVSFSYGWKTWRTKQIWLEWLHPIR